MKLTEIDREIKREGIKKVFELIEKNKGKKSFLIFPHKQNKKYNNEL